MNPGSITFAFAGSCGLAVGVAGCAEAAGSSPDVACYLLAVVFLLSGLALGRHFK